MTDVIVIVEGQTEEAFIRRVLLPHLVGHGVRPVGLLTGVREHDRTHKGGHRRTYCAIRDDIMSALKQHAPRGARVSTMLDLYDLPEGFPGYARSAAAPDPYKRVAAIEAGMAEDIADYRFMPYIQLHEFEALLLSDPAEIASEYFEYETEVQSLAEAISRFDGPELVNDGPQTAPSKRLKACIPGYGKVRAGPRIAEAIGLGVLRDRCPHFGGWLAKLEALGQSATG